MVKQVEQVKSKTLRAVCYCRTSGEGQRDNTSIPRQKAEVENFIANNKWQFVRHYVDESLSGSKIEGREAFKRMMKDAANGQFDIVVIKDIDRFSRDGFDIIGESKVLKRAFGVDVIDTKGYDTRKPRNTLLNFVKAGIAQDERLRTLERTAGGRIQKAKDGLPWCPNLPTGRGFKNNGKKSGKWFITERGKNLKKILLRYVAGESPSKLAKEYGLRSAATITQNVREGQLSGTYCAKFHSPEIGINNLEIAVPAIPQVITPQLEKRARERMAHNKVWNKQHLRKYLLTGFTKCADCGRSLVGQHNYGRIYYRHLYYLNEKRSCSFSGIRGDLLESQIFNYLYNFFLDKPAYDKAILAAFPSDNERMLLVKDIEQVERQLVGVNKKISKLADAIYGGMDKSLLLDEQNKIKNEKKLLEKRYDELNQTLIALPDPQAVKEQAMLLRIRLIEEHKGKGWQSLPYEDVRHFLHFLFGDNPKQTDYGIFVNRKADKWYITFRGCVEFNHDVIDGRPVSQSLSIAAETENKKLRKIYETRVMKANRECIRLVKPNSSNL